tara:strand:- start:565 stop:1194 length:630 start_codon:yes stop_codon:yes gene_type:complete
MINTISVLKEHKFPFESFIGGWYIPEHICDGVIQHFYENEKDISKGYVGSFSDKEKVKIDKDVKDSEDIAIEPNTENFDMRLYEQYLGICFNNYIKKYDKINNNFHFNLNVSYNIQHYFIGGGFKKWHFERTFPGKQSERVLVFMTYLNDVDDGGTEFLYQNLKTKAIKGLTLLWPTDFTHTHRGTVSMTKEKYIVTGWYSYNESLQNE